jgi:hypothetical protein
MSITRGEWLRQAEEAHAQHERLVQQSVDEAHARQVKDAQLKGIRNLTAEEYIHAASLVPIGGTEYPRDAAAMFNASCEPCDAWNGHCSCGAKHRDGI